jgi:hypothetical protein
MAISCTEPALFVATGVAASTEDNFKLDPELAVSCTGRRASSAKKALADVTLSRLAALGFEYSRPKSLCAMKWPNLRAAQHATGNGSPTFDPSAQAVLWVTAPNKPGQWPRLREEITQISGTFEELVPGACGLMKSGHTVIITHSGGAWLPPRIRAAAEELIRRKG